LSVAAPTRHHDKSNGWIVYHLYQSTKVCPDRLWRQDLSYPATHHHTARVYQREPITKLTSDREVMHRADYRETTFTTKFIGELEYLFLMAKIKSRRGLIKNKDRRLLNKRASKYRSLRLTTRDGGQQSLPKMTTGGSNGGGRTAQ
jgi:hypothetical protein